MGFDHSDFFPKIKPGDIVSPKYFQSIGAYSEPRPSETFPSFAEYDQFITRRFTKTKAYHAGQPLFVAECRQETYYVKQWDGYNNYYPYLFAKVIDSSGESFWMQVPRLSVFPSYYNLAAG